MSSEILLGDCREVLKKFPDNYFDSCVCDPPYEIGFMSKGWDSKGIAYDVGMWSEVLRVLKPNAHLLSFGATKTYHRMACAVEDAGFEIRDSLHWFFATGFPKSSAHLKPAHEPVVMARKPGKGSPALPGLDACRVDGVKGVPASPRRAAQGPAYGDLGNDPGTGSGWDPNAGRYPSNVLLSGDVTEDLDRQSGVLTSGTGAVKRATGKGHRPDVFGTESRPAGTPNIEYGDTGGASRFYPVFRYQPKAPQSERPKVDGIAHTTVKPLELMRWLVRLVTPPNGLCLDPFAGTGTTGEACRLEGFRYILIEREPDYIKLINARMKQEPSLFDD